MNMTEKQAVVDVGRGIELCYEQIGDPDDPPVVLIARPGTAAARLVANGLRLVHPTGGAATARAIRGARLETIAGMVHDPPIGGVGTPSLI